MNENSLNNKIKSQSSFDVSVLGNVDKFLQQDNVIFHQ